MQQNIKIVGILYLKVDWYFQFLFKSKRIEN